MVFYTILVYSILFCCKSSLLLVSVCYITILCPFKNYKYVSYYEFQRYVLTLLTFKNRASYI